MKRLIFLLFFFVIIFPVLAHAYDPCMLIGGSCQASCSEGEEEIELTTPCDSGICCVPTTQALVNPEASSLTCLDGTLLDSCSSAIQPNFCSQDGILTEDCLVCGCPAPEDICNPDGSCTLAQFQGQQSTDLGLINSPPLTSPIPQISSPFNLDLKAYATDPESQELFFAFQQTQDLSYSSSISACTIIDSMLSCQPAQSQGAETIQVIVSDGVKSSTLDVSIITQQASQQELNLPPIAAAGEDIVAYSGQRIILDASKSTDPDNDLIYQDSSFVWKHNNLVIGRGVTLLKRFDSPGGYTVELEVTDSAGLTSKDTVSVFIQNKNRCRNTTASYFPQDTICDNKWPSHQGELIAINSRSQSCDLIEVCDESTDYIIEDAIDCCDGSPLKDSRKAGACNFANKYSQGSQKRCQGIYLIKGIGDNAIYMQDYFEAEMCCYAVESICTKPANFYKAKPLPRTQKQQNVQNIFCKTTPANRILGNWYSDTVLSYNNIALQDLHAGATINVLATGTCVDYSVALVTLLRKIGYTQDEVFVAEASNHAYTLIRLPLDRKFHFADTTGNNAPSIILGSTPRGYSYCENLMACYNDHGKQLCPELKSIVGCEGIKEPFTKQASRFSFKTQKIVKGAVSLFVEEVKRE